MDTATSSALIRLPQVMKVTGLARSTVYKLVAAHAFPVPVRLTNRAVAWLETEVEAWIGKRPRAF